MSTVKLNNSRKGNMHTHIHKDNIKNNFRNTHTHTHTHTHNKNRGGLAMIQLLLTAVTSRPTGWVKKVIPLVHYITLYERYHFFGPPCI